jgi:glycosyltransferase involved in cell wall biosynthesis
MKSIKLLRVTTIPMSLRYLLRGQPRWMSEQGIEVHLASADGQEISNIVEFEGVDHHIVPMTRAMTPLKDIISIWKMYQLLKREKFDIVHSHTPKAGFVAMIAARLAGVKIRLHTVAGLPLMTSSGLKKWMLTRIEKITYAMATKVYPNSLRLEEFILENVFRKASKFKVIGNGSSNGINLDFFSKDNISQQTIVDEQTQLGFKPSDFVFLFIGRIVGDKGINELIEAFVRINQMHPETKLLLIGPLETNLDPLKAETLSVISEHVGIKFLGYQENVNIYYALSQALVFPSYREGFPNVPLQAGAMGLPIIGSDINGCNEIVINEENGLLVKKKSVKDLEEKMQLLIEDEKILKRMSDKARLSISSRFDQIKLWSEIHNEYQLLTQYV